MACVSTRFGGIPPACRLLLFFRVSVVPRRAILVYICHVMLTARGCAECAARAQALEAGFAFRRVRGFLPLTCSATRNVRYFPEVYRPKTHVR
jgi:hypothetical protein